MLHPCRRRYLPLPSLLLHLFLRQRLPLPPLRRRLRQQLHLLRWWQHLCPQHLCPQRLCRQSWRSRPQRLRRQSPRTRSLPRLPLHLHQWLRPLSRLWRLHRPQWRPQRQLRLSQPRRSRCLRLPTVRVQRLL